MVVLLVKKFRKVALFLYLVLLEVVLMEGTTIIDKIVENRLLVYFRHKLLKIFDESMVTAIEFE